VAITDETIGVSQLLGARAQASPKFYAYVGNNLNVTHAYVIIISGHWISGKYHT